MKLARLTHRLAASLPSEEKSGLASAMKKAALSVPVKIAESDACEEPDDAIKRLHGCEPPLRELLTTALLAYQLKMLSGFQMRKLRGTVDRVRGLIEGEIADWDASREGEPQPEVSNASDDPPHLTLRQAA